MFTGTSSLPARKCPIDKGFRGNRAETPKRRGAQADGSFHSAAAGRRMPDPYGRRRFAFENFPALGIRTRTICRQGDWADEKLLRRKSQQNHLPCVRVGRVFAVGRVPTSPRKMDISGRAARQPSVYVGFRPAYPLAKYLRALPACLPANARLTRASEAAGLKRPKDAEHRPINYFTPLRLAGALW